MIGKFVIDEGTVCSIINDILDEAITCDEFLNYVDFVTSCISGVLENELGTIYISDDYPRNVVKERFLIEHLCHPLNSELRDGFLRLAIDFERTSKFIAEDYYVEDVYSQDGYLASSFLFKSGGGIITCRSLDSESWWISEKFFIVSEYAHLINSFREQVYSGIKSFSEALEHSSKLWCNCYFTARAKRFSQLGVNELTHLKTLLKHLDYLNDYAQSDFNGESHFFIRKAASKGVELSPDSSKTHENARAMKERNVDVEGSSILCEWHTKITKTAGRVHFNFGKSVSEEVANVTGGRVIIGIFNKHLTT
ncbi:hypothetical protein [Gallaecimonas pentaromativorans]|uniref:hypothetical protein n=1 Tax=Gallaecimonas pentaromativorans TaxID=584787 RepID=UPI003A8E20F3